jgi:protein-tyrosine-phosphatase
MAEALFAKLTAGLPVEVASAGTLNIDGRQSPKEVVTAGHRLGVDLRDHRSTTMDAVGDLGEFDLVVGMAREHMAAAVVDHGARPERSFTMIELVRLLEELDGEQAGTESTPGEQAGTENTEPEPAESSHAEQPETESAEAGPAEAGPAEAGSPEPRQVGGEGLVVLEEAARSRIAAAGGLRGGTSAFALTDDIPDPIGGPRKGYETMADSVSDLSIRLARGLFGPEAVSSSLPEEAE